VDSGVGADTGGVLTTDEPFFFLAKV